MRTSESELAVTALPGDPQHRRREEKIRERESFVCAEHRVLVLNNRDTAPRQAGSLNDGFLSVLQLSDAENPAQGAGGRPLLILHLMRLSSKSSLNKSLPQRMHDCAVMQCRDVCLAGPDNERLKVTIGRLR